MQEVREGMKITLAMPEVWLAGVSGFFIYFAYTSLPYYVTYLDESYALPAPRRIDLRNSIDLSGAHQLSVRRGLCDKPTLWGARQAGCRQASFSSLYWEQRSH